MTHDIHNIQQPVSYEGPDQVLVGNGQGLFIASTGSSCFPSPLNSSDKLVLDNLLHVPHINKNLVSVSKFAKENNVFFEFNSDACFAKPHVTNKILLRGDVGVDGLYKFSNHLLKKPSAPSGFSSVVD